MKVLVTGGAGYVGTELVGRLAADPRVSEIVVYDNLARGNFDLFLGPRLPDKPIRFLRADLLDTRRLRRAVQSVDAVVHLAARVTAPGEDPHLYEQVNHWGTAEVGYAVEDSDVTQVLYLSSTLVYGAQAGAASVGATPRPQSAYAISKLRGERMLERLGGDRRLLVLRCGNIYGYSRTMRFDTVINRFVFEALTTGRVTLHGDGSQGRAFLHVDHVASTLAAMLHDDLPGGTYDLVDRNLSVLEIADAIEKRVPDLERVFVERDVTRLDLMVRPDARITDRGYFARRDFDAELATFADAFAFAVTR